MAANVATEALNKVLADTVPTLQLTGARTLMALVAAGRTRTKRDREIRWALDIGGAQANRGRTDANTVNTNTGAKKGLKLDIGDYRIYHRFSVNRVDLQNVNTLAPEDIKELFANTVADGIVAITRDMNQLIYTGDGTEASAGFVGLEAIASSAAYAGLDPSTVPGWSSNLLTNATDRPLGRDLLLDMDERVGNTEGMYDFVVTKPSVAKDYTKLFDSFGAVSVPDRAGVAGLKSADLGHGGRYLNGYPVVEDPMATAKRIYAFDSRQVTLHFMALDNAPEPTMTDIAINTTMGFPIHIAELPSSNSVIREFELYVIPQMQFANRKYLFGIDKVAGFDPFVYKTQEVA